MFPPYFKLMFRLGMALTLVAILALFDFEAYVFIPNNLAGVLLLPSNLCITVKTN